LQSQSFELLSEAWVGHMLLTIFGNRLASRAYFEDSLLV
jgi:hypothetical protein